MLTREQLLAFRHSEFTLYPPTALCGSTPRSRPPGSTVIDGKHQDSMSRTDSSVAHSTNNIQRYFIESQDHAPALPSSGQAGQPRSWPAEEKVSVQATTMQQVNRDASKRGLRSPVAIGRRNARRTAKRHASRNMYRSELRRMAQRSPTRHPCCRGQERDHKCISVHTNVKHTCQNKPHFVNQGAGPKPHFVNQIFLICLLWKIFLICLCWKKKKI